MLSSDKAFVQAYNLQTAVDHGSQGSWQRRGCRRPNDKGQ
jgi:hypothetical protein